MKGSVLIGQSGGPTAVINASLQGIIEEAFKNPLVTNVYGALNGIDGILNHQIIDFKYETKENLSLLKTTPSSILGSVRFKLEDYQKNDEIYKTIVSIFTKLNIKFFSYIGGNDSMDTCYKISQYFKAIHFECMVIGVPKTIDNDLVHTDHTPGYGSSIKYIATTIAEIYQDIECYKKGKVTIVEIMGRDAGWLTAGTKLASLSNNGPDLIYLPEVPFDIETFLKKVKHIYDKKGHALIAISEGIKDKEGKYILTYRLFNNNDDFGHLQLGGVGQVIAETINRELKLPIRSIELNIPQRCASHISSLTDIEEAYNCGKKALQFATLNHTGKMIAIKRISHNPYQITYEMVDLANVANFVKKVPQNYITNDGCNITKDFIEYALPLIQKEPLIIYTNGMPTFAKLKKKIIDF